ncbi:hypothetical protein A2715_01650 [Candidatus Woesebacteria bacterium RIFCSPHIGHO2_01_FULL_39_32]|uniref:Type 4 fimbrial biogenesis protein PilX N-terminal domain-containing protein n=2 Tax=Candidatus Woeseibacteriota TaxID=1752722 RepID=A0A0G0PRE1_9BACT|nr:MAG: hypothetical protein UT61_C0003G0032 [Candidatus Woesebacteria bacterium GW2011_GWA1_39_8]OGM23863.1 MAG: hypothetical protein A2715_01650 [Candidatus Woesebacteria bacterium RIFCSPHIGHO2_01_FULL_39_32]OGM38354.1 MAG: hypothetical protein A3F01_04940 [Candidatus Woesebacteria bacterium RIFCSPHIGHO2_12_FULL_38_11]OGM64052.1 MAG: hypothetical protein A2893_02890 [Candidatus Woesebacteria bacterium RIFCSPLOWO2_01_FULL_39_25]
MRSLPNQSGQALLVVLLTMAVILTVVLSVASRSVTDVAITSYEEEALRAFSAAEAGIESALLNPVPADPPPIPADPSDPTAATYDVLIADLAENDGKFTYPGTLASGEVATFWLVEHDDAGKLTCAGDTCFRGSEINICVGSGSPNPAIEVLVFYDSNTKQAVNSNKYANVQVYRRAFGPLGGTSSSFGSTSQCNFIDSSARRAQINVNNICSGCVGNPGEGRLLMAKVRMYYSTKPIGIWTTGAGGLPPQGIQISSTGVAGDSTRKVNVFQSYPENPTLFDSAVFSMKDLIKP